MNKKRQAHYEAFGYVPMNMKPAHFASGFFLALADETYENRLLNQVAVTSSNRGLLDDYTSESLTLHLRDALMIEQEMTQSKVELLRVQVNGIVNNDEAMFPAFTPYSPKGNDYTFFSRRLLTRENRTDGYAGQFMVSVLQKSETGSRVLEFGQSLLDDSDGTLAQFIAPLIQEEEPLEWGLASEYEEKLGPLEPTRLGIISDSMSVQTNALARLCENLVDYSHYRQVRYFTIGLLIWLVNYLLRTASVNGQEPLLLFDFTGDRDSPIRSQSQTCYARVRETVRLAYISFASSGRFSEDPVDSGVFSKNGQEPDFKELEQHFGYVALRMGYVQPRGNRVPQKHFELHPDTLRTLMLTILDHDARNAISFEKACEHLRETWCIVSGAFGNESEILQQNGYFGFDESHLRINATGFANRLAELNLAVEPSDGLVLCSRDVGEVL